MTTSLAQRNVEHRAVNLHSLERFLAPLKSALDHVVAAVDNWRKILEVGIPTVNMVNARWPRAHANVGEVGFLLEVGVEQLLGIDELADRRWSDLVRHKLVVVSSLAVRSAQHGEIVADVYEGFKLADQHVSLVDFSDAQLVDVG